MAMSDMVAFDGATWRDNSNPKNNINDQIESKNKIKDQIKSKNNIKDQIEISVLLPQGIQIDMNDHSST